MPHIKHPIVAIIILFIWHISSSFSEAQSIVQINLPQDICTSSPSLVTIGYNRNSSAVIFTPQSSLGHSERIFLPDGQPCGTMGCSYLSPVYFDAFADGAQITSVNDIQYIRLNIEHSYLGDVFIGITCPNGQSASLLNWSGGGTSACSNRVPFSARGWIGPTVTPGINLGIPYDHSGTPTCDSTANGNQPGIGWNYCWSNNTVSNYQYANYPGYIFSAGNSHGSSVDSSNVAAGTNFYHPQRSFSNLIGCPLNGEWYIEVIDAWNGDNGYIFEWELSLNSSLIPPQCEVTSRDLIGPYTRRINDSVFSIDWPSNITHDTIIPYTFRLFSSCNSSFDTTVYLHLHPSYETSETQTGCDALTYHGITYLHDQSLTQHLSSLYGCDSIAHVSLIVNQSVTTDLYDTIVQNSLPYTWNGQVLNSSGTLSSTFVSHRGCDSISTLHLTVIPNVSTTIDSTVCNSELPFSWNNILFSRADTLQVILHTTRGADSILTMILHVLPTRSRTVSEEIVENSLPHSFGQHTFFSPVSDTTLHHYTISGCDSLVHYSLTVWPNISLSFDTAICNDALPFLWHSHTFISASQTSLHFLTSHGADSTVFLSLSVHPTFDHHLSATICADSTIPFGSRIFSGSAGIIDHTDSLHSIHGCDSLSSLHLTIHPTFNHLLQDTVCSNLSYLWGTPSRYIFSPFSYTDRSVPLLSTDTLLSDHLRSLHGCDSISSLQLHISPSYDYLTLDTICADSTLLFVSSSYNTSGTFSHSLHTTLSSCDSIETLSLTVHPTFDHHLSSTICADSSLLFGSHRFSGLAGIIDHTDSLHSIHGCDSLSSLHLTIHPTFNHLLQDTVCSSTSYFWGTPSRLLFSPAIATTHTSASDTAIHYPFALTGLSYQDTLLSDLLSSIHGCDSISSLQLHIIPSFDLHFYDTLCDAHFEGSSRFPNSYSFSSRILSASGIYTDSLHTSSSSPSAPLCDSLSTLHLTVLPTSDIHLFDTIYDGDLYPFFSSFYDTTGSFSHLLVSPRGCDSLLTLHLQRNRRTYISDTICQNSMPFSWHHTLLSDTLPNPSPIPIEFLFHIGQGNRTSTIQGNGYEIIQDSIHLLGKQDIDSLVVMTLFVADTSSSIDNFQACDSLLWKDSIVYRSSTTTPQLLFTNHLLCDSIHHLHLSIHPTLYSIDHHDACDSLLWLDGQYYSQDTSAFVGPVGSHLCIGPVDTLRSSTGCDSIVSLDLVVHHSLYTSQTDTFCYNQTYIFGRDTLFSDSSYSTLNFFLIDTLRSSAGCDSVIGLHLTKMARPHLSISHQADCISKEYLLSLSCDVPYTFWSSSDPSIEGQEHLPELLVAPSSLTTYYLFADYHPSPLCPETDSIRLSPIRIPQAVLRVNPQMLTYSNHQFSAYDISQSSVARIWFIDSIPQSSTASVFEGTAPQNQDSVLISLSIFNGQCWDTTSTILRYGRVAIYAPNIFTPNESTNNHFILVTQGVIEGTLRIYNREGLLVYTTTDFSTYGWDGANAIQGSYVWRFDYRSIDYPLKNQTTHGTITLIR